MSHAKPADFVSSGLSQKADGIGSRLAQRAD